MWSETINFFLTNMGSELFSKTGNLISQISPMFSVGFGIYILIIVFDGYNRGFDDNAVELTKRALGWLVIIACAFNAGQYAKLANIAYEMPETLASAFGSQNYNASALNTAWDNIMQLVSDVSVSASQVHFSEVAEKILLYIAALNILILGGLFFGIVVAFYLVAKISLAMVLMIGPLFLGCLLFPGTRQYGMNFIGQVFNYAITVALFTLISIMQMEFFERQIKNSFKHVGTTTEISFVELYSSLSLFFLATIIFIIIALNVPSIASALTGGASSGGFNSLSRMAISMKGLLKK